MTARDPGDPRLAALEAGAALEDPTALEAGAALADAPIATLEAAAARVMRPDAHAYYATGARDERTLRENEHAWDAWWLRPRRLTGALDVSLEVPLLGRVVRHPIVVGPSAMHALAHPDAELGIARAVAALGGTMVLSMSSTTAVEEVGAVPDLDLWFQVYPLADESHTRSTVDRALAAGVRALVLTVDVPSEADTSARPPGGFDTRGIRFPHHSGDGHIRRGLDWAWAERLNASCGVPVVLKGILHPDDARRAADAGFAAIVVSNHGGRTLDGAIPSAVALPDCVAAADGRVEVYVDGGIRRGGHALMALALGARAVLVARPVLWGLALGGAAGARTVLARLVRELREDAEHAGVADLRSVDGDIVVPARWPTRATDRAPR
ncbi:MAG: alpha-hydroxy-acid oxidizing protein [Chloroflexi bacterium]|nr:alpha-hydroxy-acid oxidizing protein [Chloroflexota bacterium]